MHPYQIKRGYIFRNQISDKQYDKRTDDDIPNRLPFLLIYPYHSTGKEQNHRQYHKLSDRCWSICNKDLIKTDTHHKIYHSANTGAPVEKMEFENVDYWDELREIMDWSETNVTSTMHICWGAQAGLYYRYGVQKFDLPQKLSGIYEHHTFHKRTPLVRGFDDVFYVPHSRYTGVSKEDIVNNEHLEIVAESDVAGPYLIIGDGGKNIFVTGHPEYDVLTLDQEYHRDLAKGLNPQIPVNYYPDNDPEKKPVKKWRCHANTLYANWLNYYVYQLTPYKWE